MITLEQFTEILDKQELTDEQRQQMIDLISPFFDFNSYMREKLNKTEKEVEQLAKEYSEKRMSEFTEHLNEVMKDKEKSVIHESILLTAKVYGDFAREHGYDKCEALEVSLATYLEMTMIETFSKSNLENIDETEEE